jgi:hypothetical protein
VSAILGAVAVWLCWLTLGRVTQKPAVRLAGTIVFGLSSVFWFHASYGNSWYFSHVVAVVFLWLLLLALLREPPAAFLAGVALSAAIGSRVSLLLAVPVLAGFLWHRARSLRPVFLFGLGLLPLLSLNGAFNAARYGSPWDNGQAIAMAQNRDPVFDPARGLFHWSYVPRNAAVHFLGLPDLLPRFPWVVPDRMGMSLLLTTPAVLYAFRARRGPLTLAAWAVVLLLMLPSLFFFFTGWTQFGWRYSLDFFPFLLLLIVLGFRERVSGLAWTLIGAGVLVNLWGVVTWRLMGW